MRLFKTHYRLCICFVLLTQGCVEEPVPYDVYAIKKGSHYSTSKVQFLQSNTLSFSAVFDESAIYSSEVPENQYDINKLLGFSDCNSYHHVNSARFGWRWTNGQLEIFAYCYVDGERIIKKIDTVDINQSNDYMLLVNDDQYFFRLNDHEVIINRSNTCSKGFYYMLWPYFGGNETAPHEISILIKIHY